MHLTSERLISERLRARARGEDGFTMVAMMGVLLIVVALVFTTFSAADGDLKPGRADEDRRVAYAAAEAGIQNYLFHLVQNEDYWSRCTNVAQPHAVNQRWSGSGPDTRTNWLPIPGGGGPAAARYAIELLPANGSGQCVQGDETSIVDAATGTIRIRSTGQAGTTGPKRSIVATLRRRSFLNYLYFTDLETFDPGLYSVLARGYQTRENPRPGSPAPPQRSLEQWAAETCGRLHWYRGRSTLAPFRGQAPNAGQLVDGVWRDLEMSCVELAFDGAVTATDGDQPPTSSDRDVINGPLHSNDEILACRFPRFGRGPGDVVEVSGPGRPPTATETPADIGWRALGRCPGSGLNVNFGSGGTLKSRLGIWRPNAPLLTLPPSNAQLRDDAQPAYRFKGQTRIRLNGTNMTVTGTRESGEVLNGTVLPIPADGVVYVSADAAQPACAPYNALAPTGRAASGSEPAVVISPGCANLTVSGTYGVSLTLGAENDVIVEDDLIDGSSASTDALLGLIANNYVRVHHAVTPPVRTATGFSCTTSGGPWPNLRIDAALLALAHSFVLDNHFCGALLGTLQIFGSVSQRYRGPLGQLADGVPLSGFAKSYEYDDDLRFRAPPKFLDPLAAGWQVQLYSEQIPAR